MPRRKWSGRGLAGMTAEKKREIASKGGKAAHTLGVAHMWTSEEASQAGREKRRCHYRNTEEARSGNSEVAITHASLLIA